MKLKLGLFIILMLAIFGSAGYANAAGLNWTNDTTVTIGSTNYTIEAGSGATSIVVGATTLTVTVPDGSTFTLTSADRYELENLPEMGKFTCGSLESSLVITGSAQDNIIITPDTTHACSVGSSGSSRGATPATPATPAVTTPPADCLPGFLFSPSTGKNCGAATPAVPATPATPAQGNAYAFGTFTVKQGTKGEACLAWQNFLNAKSNAGLVTDGWCGKLSIAAAKKWQALMGLKVDGLLGPASRAKAWAQ
jgi:hypothetical protein